MGILIEIRIRAELELLWQRTQQPGLHQRWDLRFGAIEPLRGEEGDDSQRFRYATRLAPGLVITGTGTAAGERWRADGSCTSALRFASPNPLCPLARGSGYWRYLPEPGAVRFLTGYDYSPRWGAAGRALDRLLSRPLITWATAWSFDRLRIWCERGVSPERALRQAWAEVVVRGLLVAAALGAAGGRLTPGTSPGGHEVLGLVSLLIIAVVAVALPPLPTTPAARRCHHHAERSRCRHRASRGTEPVISGRN